MYTDHTGNRVLNSDDLFDLIMRDPHRTYRWPVLLDEPPPPTTLAVTMPPAVTYHTPPPLVKWDSINQSNYLIPPEYKELDIAAWVLERCTTDRELERAAQELLDWSEGDGMDILRFLKYLVDTMRTHNIVWGVGRGSSVASFVLYVIGVHRINPLDHDLDWSEFSN